VTTGVGAEKSMVLNADGKASDFITRAHALGLQVHVYTVRDDQPGAGFADSRAELEALIEAGADGIWVDYPATAVDVRSAN
jgi:glycerophosphoryl diester phosphodiesterase